LSAEYGLERGSGWVSLLETKLNKTNKSSHTSIVNASISGETTSGGRSRLKLLLEKYHPKVLILELGANDALRGLPVESSTANLDWMVPAPAQGAMVVVAMAEDEYVLDALSQLNHIETEICTYIERQFLKTLEGGCTAPIGALARYNEKDDTIEFTGVLLSIDGKEKLEINKTVDISEWKKLGFVSAQEILNNGGTELMATIKKILQKFY